MCSPSLRRRAEGDVSERLDVIAENRREQGGYEREGRRSYGIDGAKEDNVSIFPLMPTRFAL
jgi:hypothetical protein